MKVSRKALAEMMAESDRIVEEAMKADRKVIRKVLAKDNEFLSLCTDELQTA
jgi:hypothetical protein